MHARLFSQWCARASLRSPLCVMAFSNCFQNAAGTLSFVPYLGDTSLSFLTVSVELLMATLTRAHAPGALLHSLLPADLLKFSSSCHCSIFYYSLFRIKVSLVRQRQTDSPLASYLSPRKPPTCLLLFAFPWAENFPHFCCCLRRLCVSKMSIFRVLSIFPYSAVSAHHQSPKMYSLSNWSAKMIAGIGRLTHLGLTPLNFAAHSAAGDFRMWVIFNLSHFHSCVSLTQSLGFCKKSSI